MGQLSTARTPNAGSTSVVTSVTRATAILQAFDHEHPLLTLGELSRRVGLPKSTVHRLVLTLEAGGLIARDEPSGRYRLGLELLRLAAVAQDSIDLRSIARSTLERLAAELRETVHLTVLDRGEVVYIDKIESSAKVQMISRVGGRTPAHCTGVGKALLSGLPDAEVRRIAEEMGLRAYTPATITNIDELLAHLATIRERGYAIDQGEHEPFIRCVAVPIRDYRGVVIAAISATTIAASWDPLRLEEMTERTVEAAAEISRKMGWIGDRHGAPAPDGPVS